MAGTSRRTMSAALVGGLMVLGAVPAIEAQHPSSEPAVFGPLAATQTPVAARGIVQGAVMNARGEPLAGAVVLIVGAVTSVAVADEQGRYEFGALPPGMYRLRVRAEGYDTLRRRAIDVRPGARLSSMFLLSEVEASPQRRPTVLAAGLGGGEATSQGGESSTAAPGSTDTPSQIGTEADQAEVVWRLRHQRRGVLREASVPGDLLVEDRVDVPGLLTGFASRAVGSPLRLATNLFADVPFTGQFQFLTTSSFDAPAPVGGSDRGARGIAFVRVGAPVGDRADWTVRGAMTEADIASWFIAGAYKSRGTPRRSHDMGMSYSIQHYVGGNPLALRAVTDSTRNVGTVYAFETLRVTRLLALTYGGHYARHDYLARRDLLSPRATLSLATPDGTRWLVAVSSRADAPGAVEFLPPGEHGLWLPPQRTFSPVEAGGELRAQRVTQVDAGVERAFGTTTFAIRAFRQRVDDQMLTVFGVDAGASPGSRNGHYIIGTAGDTNAAGGSVAVRSTIGSRVRGSLAYSIANARIGYADGMDAMVPRLAARMQGKAERLHDVSASLEAEVPETATRLLAFYRLGNGFATTPDLLSATGLDSRFDVQLRQSLPFLNFTSARWEMLMAIRNYFRDPASDQSIYDELLTVRAPRRLVGGVSLLF
jgi:Carboxypeptidase regulatory-like domain/TonB dependent receptor